MKPQILVPILASAVMLAGCSKSLDSHQNQDHPARNPPPGYGVACDGKGNFCMVDPDGHINKGGIFASRRALIEFEWDYVEAYPRLEAEAAARDAMEFKVCKPQ